MPPCTSVLVYSSRPRRAWSEAARLVARRHPLIITDVRGRSLRDFLRAASVPVWVEGFRSERLRRVLVAIDPLAPPYVLGRVLEMAKLVASLAEAELLALHAWDAPGEQLLVHHGTSECARRYVAEQRERACAMFDEYLRVSASGIGDSHRLCVRGDPSAVIARIARERDIDAVVLGMTRRPRVARRLLGCTAVRLAAMVTCHLIVLPSAEAVPERAALPRAVALRRVA